MRTAQRKQREAAVVADLEHLRKRDPNAFRAMMRLLARLVAQSSQPTRAA